MKAPVKISGEGNYSRWAHPDRDWLVDQHHTQEKPAKCIAREVGVSGTTLTKWLRDADVEVMPHEGPRHHLWTGGSLRRAHYKAKRALRRERVPEVCSWCGQGQRTVRGRSVVELHHKDHDPYNNDPDNLQWLCFECHHLETYLWLVLNQGKAIVEAKGDTITIQFPHLSET